MEHHAGDLMCSDIHVCTHIHTCMYTYIYTRIYFRSFSRFATHTSGGGAVWNIMQGTLCVVNICVCTHIHTYMYTYIFVCIHIHIQTYIFQVILTLRDPHKWWRSRVEHHAGDLMCSEHMWDKVPHPFAVSDCFRLGGADGVMNMK